MKPEIIIRPLQASDATSLFAAVRASLPELSATLPWCHADYAIDDARQWITSTIDAWSSRREFPFGIVDARNGAIIGGVGISQINPRYAIGNLGYWVATSHAGRGIARFAAHHVAALAFGELGLARLEIVVLPGNIASQRVAEAVGATREYLARHRIHHHGKPCDAWVYSLTPADIPAASSA